VRTLVKVVVCLLVVQIVLAIVWPQDARDRAAAAIAHSICSQRPQPEECGPNGHPWDPIRRVVVGQP
jgi:hypothetical protein